MRLGRRSLAVAGLLAATPFAARAARFEEPARLPFREGRPTPATAAALREELLFQQATQSYLWALPLLNTLGMQLGSEAKFGAGYNVLPIWKRRLDAKTLVTTPNSDVIYAMSYLDLGRDGPMVMVAPPLLQGILLDAWQRPIPVDGGRFAGDVGFAGPDGGQGGRLLIVPPGWNGTVPEGHIVYRSGTNTVFVFLRGFYEDPKVLGPAVALLEKARFFPLGGEATARPMVFPDASGVPVDMLPLRDGRAFQALHALLNRETPGLADADWLGMLAQLGIRRGVPFAPEARERRILNEAARTGYAMSRVIGLQESVGGHSLRAFPDRHWLNPLDNISAGQGAPVRDLAWQTAMGWRDLEMRSWFFTNYYSVSPGMLSKVPGKGAAYLIAFSDAAGAPLSGGSAYRLRLPGPVPAANFWSLTLYDAANGSGLANGQPFPSLGSRDKPAAGADGATTLHLGPKAPAGQAGNWLATVPGKAYFVVLRLYGPEAAAIERRWKPGDLERVK